MTRWIVVAVLACVAVFAWAVHDLNATIDRALRLPEDSDA